jgi:hypothetical protein
MLVVVLSKNSDLFYESEFLLDLRRVFQRLPSNRKGLKNSLISLIGL